MKNHFPEQVAPIPPGLLLRCFFGEGWGGKGGKWGEEFVVYFRIYKVQLFPGAGHGKRGQDVTFIHLLLAHTMRTRAPRAAAGIVPAAPGTSRPAPPAPGARRHRRHPQLGPAIAHMH